MDNSFFSRDISLSLRLGSDSGHNVSRLWYAAIVPLLGIYIEVYANSFRLGVLVWGLAAVMSCAACLFDYSYIGKHGYKYDALKPAFALLPPVYIFKRTKLTGDSSVCGAVWCIMFVYALIFNGFTTAANLKKSEMTGAIKESKWSYISGFDDVSADKTVEETLKELFTESGKPAPDLDWNAEKHSGYVTVTCEVKDGDGGAEFRLDFDGYCFGTYHIVSLTENGKKLASDKAVTRIKELLPKDESSEADDSSDPSEAAVTDESTGEAKNIYSGDLI